MQNPKDIESSSCPQQMDLLLRALCVDQQSERRNLVYRPTPAADHDFAFAMSDIDNMTDTMCAMAHLRIEARLPGRASVQVLMLQAPQIPVD
jgi:hypothetical protein